MSQRNEQSTRPELSSVTQWLIHQAAHRAPEALSSRLEEEWLADLASRSAGLSRLRFAVGCCWATLLIAHDYPRGRVAATRAVAPAGGFVTLVDRNFGYFSLRSATLFLIAGLHAALFYGLITILAHPHSAATTPANLQNYDVPAVPPEKVPVVVSAPELEHWTMPQTLVDPPPQLTFEKDVISNVSDKPPEVISQPVTRETPTHVVQRLAGGPGAGFPETADFYPAPSIRLEEEGLTTVQVCVDKKGRLTSEPSAMKSSGSARLDEAAIRLARAGSGHYRATTEDGQPVNSCYPFGVRFQLRK